MKKVSFLIFSMVMIIAFSSCKKKTMYIYIDNEADEPKVEIIEADDDAAAYYKCFEKYSNSRHYPEFSAVKKSKEIITTGQEACESDEFEQQGVPVADESLKGDVLPSDDSDFTGEYVNPGLLPDIEPNFKLYKLTDKEAQQAAQDLVDKKISYEEFEKKIKGKSEVIDLYKKDFKKCEEIFNKVYEELKVEFKKEEEQEAKQKEQ